MADITRRSRSCATCAARRPATSGTCSNGQGRGTRATGAVVLVPAAHRGAVSEVPVDDRELPLLFHARTSDFHDVHGAGHRHVPGHRPGAGRRAGSTSPIDPLTGRWRGHARWTRSAALLAELAQQPALDLLARLPLTEALTAGIAPVRERGRRRRSRDDAAAGRDRRRRGQRPGRRDPARARARAGAADADPRGGAAGGRPGHLRAPGARGRAGAGDRRERAAEPDRAGPPRGAAGRAARRERPAPGGARTPPPAGVARRAPKAAAAPRQRAVRAVAEAEARPGGVAGAARGAAAAEARRSSTATATRRPRRLLGARAARSSPASCPEIGQLTVTPDVCSPTCSPRLADGARPMTPRRRGSWWCTGAASSTSCSPGTAPARRPGSSCAHAAATWPRCDARHDARPRPR